MDIHTDYLEAKMAKNVPELKEYLDVRKCSNFTSKPYASEPHDERHEEFNKRGQNVKTADDFKQSFQLVDHYTQMKDSCFEDYQIKSQHGCVLVSWALCEYITPPCCDFACGGLEDHHQIILYYNSNKYHKLQEGGTDSHIQCITNI
jgi:hypothetical protein